MVREWGPRANELSAEAIGSGEPTTWFDRLYAEGAAGEISLPWDRTGPHPMLLDWAETTGLVGDGRRAVVVGCGLGADAAYLASLRFATTGFDLSETAVRLAAERYPDIDVRVANLLELPDDLRDAFDLVVEIYTIQAVPDPPRAEMMTGVASLVAPGGTLLAVQLRHDGTEPADVGPPFPLTEETMRRLAGDRLTLTRLEALDGPLWRAEYQR